MALDFPWASAQTRVHCFLLSVSRKLRRLIHSERIVALNQTNLYLVVYGLEFTNGLFFQILFMPPRRKQSFVKAYLYSHFFGVNQLYLSTAFAMSLLILVFVHFASESCLELHKA